MAGFAEYMAQMAGVIDVEYLHRVFNHTGNRDIVDFNADGKLHRVEMATPASQVNKVSIRPYFFVKGHRAIEEHGTSYLQPPDGGNLKNCIQAFSTLRQDVAKLFSPRGLKLLLHLDAKPLEVIKDLEGIIYSYPYSSTADTLQRLIFYLAAIESNTDSVLLFEEPEAHSFPEYVIQLAERIVSSRDNQFFVVTHSPYLTTEVLEQMVPNAELLPELAVFVMYYEDYQTKIRQLSDDEVITARANGTELFLNLRQFVPGSGQ